MENINLNDVMENVDVNDVFDAATNLASSEAFTKGISKTALKHVAEIGVGFGLGLIAAEYGIPKIKERFGKKSKKNHDDSVIEAEAIDVTEEEEEKETEEKNKKKNNKKK